MFENEEKLKEYLYGRLADFEKKVMLPGISGDLHRETLVLQLIDSWRRIRYYQVLAERGSSASRADPYSESFDPFRGAIFHRNTGNLDEAFWLVFLGTHFGISKNWGLLKAIYGDLESGNYWSWERSRAYTMEFISWIDSNKVLLSKYGWFGNHRKYENLDRNMTGRTLYEYLGWVAHHQTHGQLIEVAARDTDGTPKGVFGELYRKMRIYRFGRLGKFDFLTMLGKLGLANIEPDSMYLDQATGPKKGANLLISGNREAQVNIYDQIEILNLLEADLGIPFGMQMIEDAICNWQKNPNRYIKYE